MPTGIDLDLRLTAGTIDVDLATTNDLRVELESGTVAAKVPALAGECRMRVTAGQIKLAVREQGPAGGLDIECSSGEVDVTLPATLRGSFDLATTAGDVRVDARYGLQVSRELATATARGKVGEAGPQHRVHITTGQIVLR